MKKKLSIALLVLFILFTLYFINDTLGIYRFHQSNENLAEMIEESEEIEEKGHNGEVLQKYSAIYAQNKEFAGWIRIPGTLVDYPVMMPLEDNNFYLDHGPDGQKSKYGAVFMDKKTDLFNQKGNYILYGHYFRDGSMFGTLTYYKDESYWKEHPIIEFDTIYEEGRYEVVSVFLSQVYRKADEVFKYYTYVDITSQEDFEYYVDEVKKLSLYDTGNDAEYGDALITLSTCDYYTENGRLVLVAKKIKD